MERRTDPASWRRVREIFDAVVSLAPAERDLRLTDLCADDPALRQEVESLLSHDGSSGDAIASVVARAAHDATAPETVLHAGQTLLHYKLTARIGEGGMGVVWKATDRSLGREVAIKTLPAIVAKDPSRLARFEREARLLAALNHSNVAAIYSVHEFEDVRFLAMEYVEGEDLASRLARGALPLDQTLAIARQIADGLEEAHEKGIVHRDLKPANVKLKPDGKVKVLDFGLAKAFAGDPSPIQHADPTEARDSSKLATQAGLVMGTAAYMPPEQARGLPVDKRADNWAFGVLLFEMLSGRRPFGGATLTDVLAAVVTAEPDWRLLPTGTPPSLVRLVRRCLQKDVRQRLRDIGDARIEIDALIGGHAGDSSASIAVATSTVSRPRWREAALFLLGAAAGLTVWLVTRTAPVEPDVQRLNVALAPGTRLEDVLEAGRQTLALSRDGTRLAFVTRGAGGRKQIHLRRLDSVMIEPVPGTEGGDMPFFSPDGAWIGYAADGKLLRVPVAGGQPIVICDAPEPRGASWGEDGTILFAPGVFSGLSRVSLSGGTPVQVTTPRDRVEAGHRWPSLLPGGRAALFNVESPGPDEKGRTIEVVQLETGERRPLLRGASYARYVDGHVIFGQAGRLLAAPFDVSRLELAGPAVPVLDDVRMDLASTGRVFFDVAASGSLVYVPGALRPGERTLVWIDRQGNSTPATAEKRAYRGARLSPDGLAVATTIEGPPTSLWSYDLARGAWKRLTFDGDVNTPAWTPDGAHLVYALSQPSGRTVIYRIATDGGGGPERLTPSTTTGGDMPSVAPNGRLALIAVQGSAGDDIHSLSLDAPHTIAPFQASAANETSPAISPSGRYVAYTSTESGRREIYIRPFSGPARTWAVSAGGGAAPRWRRDERELFYLAGPRMMAVSVNTSGGQLSIATPQVLFEESALTWSGADLFRYDVTGDGQRFITVKPEAREEAPLQLVVIPQFAREMRARLAAR